MTSELMVQPRATPTSTTDADPLLAAKFAVPETPPFAVERRRLLDRLSAAARHPVTAVTGPPGSGKTQLAAAWVSAGGAPGPAVWITLEDGDDVPAVFWPYLVEGLHRADITLSPPIDEAARSGSFDRPLLARLAADLAAQQDLVVLILDSASVLSDRQLAEDLDALLRHADRHLRLILVGRWDPPLSLYRYRLAGTLGEIRAEDLAFTVAETSALLAAHAVEMPDWAIRCLVERTEGWAVGLRLFAMAMQGGGKAEDLVVSIAGDDTNIAEYFLGEVLAAQSPEVREFLLRTSVVDDFTTGLAEALIERGDARRILAELERANAFVQPVAKHSAVHRYHRLFAELLRAQQSYEEPVLTAQLHRRAAAWFATHGQIADATRHAVHAKDWRYACALVLDDLGIGHLLPGGDADQLARSFQDMPEDADGPEAALVAAARWLAADPDRAAEHLDRAMAAPEAATRARQTVPFRMSAALVAIAANAMRGDVAEAGRWADAAEALIGQLPADRVAAHPELRTTMLFWRAAAQSNAGALNDAIATLTEGVRTAPTSDWAGLRLACLEQQALLNACQGRLREAADAAGQAVELTGRRHRTSTRPSPAASAVLAWVDTERWAVAAAWRHLRAAEAALATLDDPQAAVVVALVRSRLLVGRGELRGAFDILSETLTQRGSRRRPRWLDQEVRLGQARLAVAMGRPDEALAIITSLTNPDPVQATVASAAARLAKGEAEPAAELVAPVVQGGESRTPLLIEAWLILAVAASEKGEPRAVHDSLREALTLAAAGGYRRPFHHGGPQLRKLLRSEAQLAAAYRSLGSAVSPKSRITTSAMPPGADEPIVVDPLSERELQVLRHLAAMLGTEEIADAMYLSVNTVKTHVRSILRKLAATRRNEAVRRARTLGLV